MAKAGAPGALIVLGAFIVFGLGGGEWWVYLQIKDAPALFLGVRLELKMVAPAPTTFCIRDRGFQPPKPHLPELFFMRLFCLVVCGEDDYLVGDLFCRFDVVFISLY
jgi:hypothetical protein